jgi:prephenate dehydrogenase
MDAIVQDLREGCVVMDTAPARQAVLDWLPGLLPKNRFYVGLTPVLNPQYLQDPQRGQAATHADLFKGGQLGIVAPPNTDAGALKMAADLAGLLGASPIFADAAEMDGLMAAAHVLPQLLGAVLLHATVDQPGWREARRLAGQPYEQISAAMMRSSAAALAAQAAGNRQNSLRVLNDALIALQDLRDELAADDPTAFEAHLARLHTAQETWWKGRLAKEWQQESAPSVSMPDSGGMFSRLFFGGRKPKKP